MKKHHAYFHAQPVSREQMAVEYDELVDERTRMQQRAREVPGEEEDTCGVTVPL